MSAVIVMSAILVAISFLVIIITKFVLEWRSRADEAASILG
jgi:hypothetical protein